MCRVCETFDCEGVRPLRVVCVKPLTVKVVRGVKVFGVLPPRCECVSAGAELWGGVLVGDRV